MKQKSLITITILLFILSLTLFIACENKEEGEPGKEDVQLITAETKFEDIISDVISQDDFESIKQNASSEINFRCVVESSSKMADYSISYNYATVDVNGNIVKAVDRTENENGNIDIKYSYSVIEDTVTTTWWSSDNLSWKQSTKSHEYAAGLKNMYNQAVLSMGSKYDDMTWSDEEKGYVVNVDENIYYFVFKFVDNRLAGMASVYEGTESQTSGTVIFYDFKKVPEITLPEITE